MDRSTAPERNKEVVTILALQLRCRASGPRSQLVICFPKSSLVLALPVWPQIPRDTGTATVR